MNKSAEKLIHDLLTQIARLEDDTLHDAHEQQHPDHDHDHDHYEPNDPDDQQQQAGDLLVAKVTAMCTLFIASTLCGCIPFLLNRWFNWTQATTGNIRTAAVINGLLYFGGGVLLCTTFLHLLPEVAESIARLQECNMIPTLTFHLPHLLMCIGFFAMFLVEEIIHVYLHRYRKHCDSAQQAFERGRSIRNSSLVKGSSPAIGATGNTLSKEELISGEDDVENQNTTVSTPGSIKHQKSSIQADFPAKDPGHDHLTHIAENMIVSSLRGLLVVLALSVHELFEGLAVGLESRPSRVWYMFGAVSAHKLILAFCVGVELIVTRTKLWLALAYVITFAIVSPLGIGIGIYVSADDDSFASAIPSVILQGLASGTLLYVVFFEILSKERSGIVAYVAFIIGFSIMFGLQIATSASHHHSHGHCGASDHREHHEQGHHHLHDVVDQNGSADSFMVSSTDEKLKLIQEATEELAKALSAKIK